MRPLPEGLSACAACGTIRGTTPAGIRSLCFCEGVACNWCGARLRRPISDYYDRRGGGRWLHVPHFALGTHGCQAPQECKLGPHFTTLPLVEDHPHGGWERLRELTYRGILTLPSGESTKVH